MWQTPNGVTWITESKCRIWKNYSIIFLLLFYIDSKNPLQKDWPSFDRVYNYKISTFQKTIHNLVTPSYPQLNIQRIQQISNFLSNAFVKIHALGSYERNMPTVAQKSSTLISHGRLDFHIALVFCNVINRWVTCNRNE